jgi:hypothetical protein
MLDIGYDELGLSISKLDFGPLAPFRGSERIGKSDLLW